MSTAVFLVVLMTVSGDTMYITNNGKGYTAKDCMVEAPKQFKAEVENRKYHNGLVYGDPYSPKFDRYDGYMLERYGSSVSYSVEWDHNVPRYCGCISYPDIIDKRYNKDLTRFKNVPDGKLYSSDVMKSLN